MEKDMQGIAFHPPAGVRLFAGFNVVIMLVLISMGLLAYFQQGVMLGLALLPVFLLMTGGWVWIFIAWGTTVTLGEKAMFLSRLRNPVEIAYRDIKSVEHKGSSIEIHTATSRYRVYYPSMKTLQSLKNAIQVRLPRK